MTSASYVYIEAVELMVLPLLTVRFDTPLLSRIARPVPVCLSVPRLVSVALLPEMVTATVEPLKVSDPAELIKPVCPEPLPKVCEVVDALVIVKGVAKAEDVLKGIQANTANSMARTLSGKIFVTDMNSCLWVVELVRNFRGQPKIKNQQQVECQLIYCCNSMNYIYFRDIT